MGLTNEIHLLERVLQVGAAMVTSELRLKAKKTGRLVRSEQRVKGADFWAR